MKSVKTNARKALSLFLTICMLLSALAIPRTASAVDSNILLAKDAEWKYLVVDTDQGSDWRTTDFDDSSWAKGEAPLGFGDAFSETDPTLPLATEIGFGQPAPNKNITTYFRNTINVSNLNNYTELEVYVHVDDGAVVYINGTEAFRRGIADGVEVNYNTGAKFSQKEETFKLPVTALKEGLNTIAAEVHQDDGSSSDLWFEMSIKGLTGQEEPPEEPTVTPDPNAPIGTVSKVTVTFNGDTTSTKGFTWFTTLRSVISDLQVVEKTSDSPDFSQATKFSGTCAVPTYSTSQFVHKAEATGLKANTEYFFRVGEETIGLWSEVGTFKTAPQSGAFTFVDIADPQAKTEDEAILSSETIAKALDTVDNAEFLAINGDIVDTGSNEQQWDWVFGHSQTSLLKTTILPAAGNHESQKNSFIEHFDIKPAANSPTTSGAYFSYDYSNAHFIILNNNESSTEYADFTPAQIQWMKDDVAAAKSAGAKWIIVIMHKGPYSTSNHATDSDIMGTNGVRTKVVPIMSQLGIDLVLQGHDHGYARTKPIKEDGTAATADKITETLNGKTIEYNVNPDGSIYLIPATAGPKVYYKNTKISDPTNSSYVPGYYDLFDVADENHAAVYGPDPDDASRPMRAMVQNFEGITIDDNRLTVVSYEIDQGDLIDHDINKADPYIIDQFGIEKQSEPTDYGIKNPYATVNWSTFGQYKADFHAHSVESDGADQPASMIEEHYSKDYDILAMTDHNFLSTTWDRTDRAGKTYLTPDRLATITAGTDRNDRGMTAIPSSDEQSLSDHVNTFFAPFNNEAGATLESSIAKAQELGGISHINHPGRYTGGAGKTDAAGEAASSAPATIAKYVDLFERYPSCVGMEIINKKDGDSASDRILWDNILKQTMPNRAVWGFSNDDTHALANTGFSYNMMLMPENTLANVRNSMEDGIFYAVALVSKRELGSSFVASGPAPKITNISVNEQDDSIAIEGENYNTIEWVADGKIIATGNTIDLDDYEDQINNYIRAQLKGDGGISFTQPFGIIDPQAEPELAEVTLTTDGDTLPADSTTSIKLNLTGKDNLGADIGLSTATVNYKTDKDGVLAISADGKVTVQNAPAYKQNVKIWAEITLGGKIVISNTVSITVSGTEEGNEIVVPIKNSLDDIEERPDGSLDYDSSDLEIVWESPTSADLNNQLIGLRFADLAIPKGATITDAYIQFSVDEPAKSFDPFKVNIYAEDVPNSAAFEKVAYTVSSRVKTTDSIEWKDAPLWTTEHEAGSAEQTANLASLVQKIVDKDGWNEGNALSFILSGIGNRTAESFEGAGSHLDQVPTLHLVYTTPIAPENQGPSLQNVSLDSTNKIVTLDFDKSLISNVADLKTAITFATDGTTFNALGASDSVSISSSDAKKLIVTFNSPLTGANNKLQIAANSLKDASDNVQTSVVTTPEISGTIDECFIATAAYGSIYQQPVVLLRHFRDKFLLTNSGGQAFVKFYYHNSPPIARFIAGNEFLKLMVRIVLTPTLLVAYLLFHPILGLTFFLLLVGILYMKRAKRKKLLLA